MKIETRLGKATKIGYTMSGPSEPERDYNPSRMPVFEIDPNKGRTIFDEFMTSQDPAASFLRGFFKGLGKVAMFVVYALGFIVPFWFVAGLF